MWCCILQCHTDFSWCCTINKDFLQNVKVLLEVNIRYTAFSIVVQRALQLKGPVKLNGRSFKNKP